MSIFIRCGTCEQYHLRSFTGDCRDDANRFTFDQLNDDDRQAADDAYEAEPTDQLSIATARLRDLQQAEASAAGLEPYTVVLIATGRDDAFCEHVKVANPGDAYEAALRQVYADSEPKPDEYPFDLDEAKSERPLAAVFPGHLINLAA